MSNIDIFKKRRKDKFKPGDIVHIRDVSEFIARINYKCTDSRDGYYLKDFSSLWDTHLISPATPEDKNNLGEDSYYVIRF